MKLITIILLLLPFHVIGSDTLVYHDSTIGLMERNVDGYVLSYDDDYVLSYNGSTSLKPIDETVTVTHHGRSYTFPNWHEAAAYFTDGDGIYGRHDEMCSHDRWISERFNLSLYELFVWFFVVPLVGFLYSCCTVRMRGHVDNII